MQQIAVNHYPSHNAGVPFDTRRMPQESAVLKSAGVVTHFQRNQTIFSEGDDADYVFKVVSGAVRLCKVLADGRRQIAEFALVGDYFGLEWLSEYSLTAEALSDVSLVRYQRNQLDRVARENREVGSQLVATMQRGLWAAQTHLLMLGRQSASERLASFLLQLMERNKASAGLISIPMNRQDIADYLGLTIETVCRILSAFKRARLISIPSRTQIRLINVGALQDMADGEDLAAA